MSAPSSTTQALVEQLLQRDQIGQRKYGTSLDRADLGPEEWAQHAIEEALDMAGYLARFAATLGELRAENLRLAEENVRLRAILQPILELARTVEITHSHPGHIAHSVEAPLPSVSAPMPHEAEIREEVELLEEGGAPPTPELAVHPSKATIPLPPDCIGAVDAAAKMGVARNTFSGYVPRGLISWAGEYTTPSGNMGKYVTQKDLDALPAKLEKADKERREAMAERMRATPTAVRSEKSKVAVAAKRDSERPEGGVSYEEAAKFLSLSRDSVRIYAQRGLLKRIGETPYVTRASVLARKQSMGLPAPAAFDLNEAGRLAAIDEGKSFFRPDRYFGLVRRDAGSSYQWLVIARGADSKGGEIVEHWSLSGLGQWESTPHLPGVVGTGNGTSKGAAGYKVPVLG